MVSSDWELFEHGADIGVRGFGQTKDAAFERTAMAMTAVITDPHKVAADVEVDISCEAPDDELLLVEWLNTLVYEMATRHLLFGRFEVHTENGVLHAKAWGEQIDRAKHEPAVEVKGATYTALQVRHDNSTWIAQCVVDV
jgi:tRNA nucleotidyltransferase (CCA-adding enzyme)